MCSFLLTETLNGTNRYIYVSNELSWSDAQVFCRKYHTDLATINDTAENSFVLELISNDSWFGLFRDSWIWVGKTPVSSSIINWMPGKPDNAQGNENCGYLYNNLAVDAQCSDEMPFFCYSSK